MAMAFSFWVIALIAAILIILFAVFGFLIFLAHSNKPLNYFNDSR